MTKRQPAHTELPSRHNGVGAGEASRVTEQAFLSTLLHSSESALIGTSLDGVIHFWNAGAERTYGYTSSEIMGGNIATLIPDDHTIESAASMRQIRLGRTVRHHRTTRLHKDGRRIEVDVNITPVHSADSSIVGALEATCDRQDGNKFERAEHEIAARLKAVVETAVDGIITIDAHGTIETVNPAVERLFGWEAGELIGKNVRALMPDPFANEHDQYLTNYRQTGIRKIIGIGREVLGLRKDGTTFPMELAVSETQLGNRTIFTGLVHDISTRRRAELALMESEARFAAFMQHLPAASWIKDLDGRYVYANQEAHRIFDTAPDRLLGKTDHDIFPEAIAIEFRNNDRRALQEGGSLQAIEVLRHADGSEHRSMVHKFALPNSSGEIAYVGGIALDITELLQTRESLHESKSRFRIMADSAPVLIWMSDEDKACTWFNKGWLRFTGRSMEQEIGYGWAENVHPDDLAECIRIYNESFDARVPFEMQYRLRRFDGEYRWVQDTGVPMYSGSGNFTGYIGSCLDITQNKLSQEHLHRQVEDRTRALSTANKELRRQIERRYQAESLLECERRILELIASRADCDKVLETICDTIPTLFPDSRVLIQTTHKSRHTPSENETNGSVTWSHTDQAVYGPLREVGLRPPLTSTREIFEDLSTQRWANRHTLGRPREIQACWNEPIPGYNGQNWGTLHMFVSQPRQPNSDELEAMSLASRLAALALERDRSEAQSRQQLSQLAHVARLATMGEMASGLAHELNQPLCAIVNYTEACTEMISRNGHDTESLTQILTDIARQAERAGQVIRRLREFVRKRELMKESVDINEIIHGVIALTNIEARQQNVRIQLRLAKRLPRAHADPIQIEQVLVNLIRNALDAMKAPSEYSPKLTVQTRHRSGFVEVSVSDNGQGLSKDSESRLFEPFFTTKGQGMGMGLCISRSIVEAHDGRIWATANPTGGATFQFTLPVIGRRRDEQLSDSVCHRR